MSVVQVSGAAVTASSTNNNGGTMVDSGSASSGVMNTQASATEPVGVFASTPIDGDSADKALSGGTFAYNNNRPVAKIVTEEISGVANTFLRSGAADPSRRQAIHKMESKRTRRVATAIRAGYWNIVSGTFGTTPTVANDSFGNDDAARPTTSVPGEFTYRDGSPEPINDNYKARTTAL